MVVVVIGVAVGGAWLVPKIKDGLVDRTPGCAFTERSDPVSGAAKTYSLSVEQADNAATIAGVGIRLGMPNHAMTVALATALQESKLQNLPNGDRDSVGLFQQRPSQGWGTQAQVFDPVYAATAFYTKLRELPDWTEVTVTEAAQAVQRSAAPAAYAKWEPQARAVAAALTGETTGAAVCRNLSIEAPGASIVDTAAAELGTTALGGAHPIDTGWSISSWLVAHASRFAVDRVSFDGQTWTAASGRWSQTGPTDATLSLHQAQARP